MNWAVFWQALGSVATTAAVIVALWQTRFVNNKKAKISFVENRIIVPAIALGSYGYMPESAYVGLEFANIGNRKIIIKSFWVELSNDVRAVIAPEVTPVDTLTWPVEVDIEESVFLPWSKEKFLEFIQNEERLDLNRKLTFCVCDTTGKIYKCITPKVLQKYL